jgi:hypothetical protein
MTITWRRLQGVLVLVLTLLAVLLPVTSRSAPAQAAAAVPGGVGVQWHAVWSSYDDAQRVRVLDSMKAAGVGWVRMDIGWDLVENQYQGQRDPYWTGRIDSYINMAVARGIKPLVTLYQTPAWARPAGTSNRVPPTDPATYASFARWAAERWAGKVAAWEVWNEPNLEEFWVGTDAVRYAQLLRAAYPAFKAGDPSAKVVAGAVSYNDDVWLRSMYQAGAAGSFDVLSTHPYQGPADAAPEVADDGNRWHLTHAPAIRELMLAYGDGAKPVWFTELGWSTHANTGAEAPWSRGVTDQQQADYIVRALKLIRSSYPWVTNVFLYNERDRTDADTQNNNFGLMRADLSPKPAYTALRSYLLASAPLPPRNLLQSAQATLDSGTSGWTTTAGDATLTPRTAPLSLSGGAAELTGTARAATADRVAMQSDVRRTAVTEGRTYTAMISARARTTGRSVTIFLNWFSATGTYLGQAAGAGSDSTTGWTSVRVVAVAPPGAAHASITVQVQRPVAGEAHLFDAAGLFPGSVTTWSAP